MLWREDVPRSVMIAVISAAGVTSKAGWRARAPFGAMERPRNLTTSFTDRSSMGMPVPVGVFPSIVEKGAAT
jgi:hypothetical protein